MAVELFSIWASPRHFIFIYQMAEGEYPWNLSCYQDFVMQMQYALLKSLCRNGRLLYIKDLQHSS